MLLRGPKAVWKDTWDFSFPFTHSSTHLARFLETLSWSRGSSSEKKKKKTGMVSALPEFAVEKQLLYTVVSVICQKNNSLLPIKLDEGMH